MTDQESRYPIAKTARLIVLLSLLMPLSAGAQQPKFSIDDLDVQARDFEHHNQSGNAIPVRMEILRRIEGQFSADDIRLIKPLNDVVRDSCIDGKCASAIPFLEQLLKIRQKRFGSKNVEVANTYLLLGEAHEKMHEYDRACTYFKQAAQMQAQLTAANSNESIGFRSNIIRSLKEKGDLPAAQKETEECMSLLATNKTADAQLKSLILGYHKEFGSKQLR